MDRLMNCRCHQTAYFLFDKIRWMRKSNSVWHYSFKGDINPIMVSYLASATGDLSRNKKIDITCNSCVDNANGINSA